MPHETHGSAHFFSFLGGSEYMVSASEMAVDAPMSAYVDCSICAFEKPFAVLSQNVCRHAPRSASEEAWRVRAGEFGGVGHAGATHSGR